MDPETHLTNAEILEHATKHDLPICISIDGGDDKKGTVTSSISILAPDIRENDCIGSEE
jgi:hypothetical protein